MEKGKLLYEGKAKKVYETDDPRYLVVSYKDDATAQNGLKRGQILGKGAVNNRMSNVMFRLLEAQGVPTHYVRELSDRETLVRRVGIVPLEVIVRNVAAGSFSKRFGVEEGRPLLRPTLEHCLKDDALGDPMLTETHALALGLATQAELDEIERLAWKVNAALQEALLGAGLILVDFKLEFGRAEGGQVILADEISPDTCRLWDRETRKKLDKDRFRNDMGGVEEAYRQVMERVGALQDVE
jgi:phosphoribosylaminoimidazole-succinocarboxamide synthase